ncbi:MAG TPA: hypothetical protein ENL20_05735 [Candidatus Cloacimonetes bacterium]|nr:hypothetical protein [Candidatus Cloacimonadota bacterium]
MKQAKIKFYFAIIIILTMSLSLLNAQNIISVQDGDWGDPDTWNLDRYPDTGDWVLIDQGNSVRLDLESAWDWLDDVYQRLDIEGTLYPEVLPDYFHRVRLRADDEIHIGLNGRLLGFDINNFREPDNTGVSVMLILEAETIDIEGEILGGNNFQSNWGAAIWSTIPTYIRIGNISNLQTLQDFLCSGTITAGSGVMGQNLLSRGGNIRFFVGNNFINAGTIQAGNGYAQGEPFARGGDIIIRLPHNIDGNGGRILGGFDMGPDGQTNTTCSNILWIGCPYFDNTNDIISFSGPGTQIDRFGLLTFRARNWEPITTIDLSNLDLQAIQTRKHYNRVVTDPTGPARGGSMRSCYRQESFVDLTGNPEGVNVLVSEEEDIGGVPAYIYFSRPELDANILLDPEVDLNEICEPDPIFLNQRQLDTLSMSCLYPGFPDISEMSEPYLIPGLGFPGEMAHIPIRFVNLGERYDFHIEISDELGYSFYPNDVWVYSYDDPDTTFTIDVQIPYSAPIGTTNNFQITSSTYPEGDYPDVINWKVVVVPPVKVYPEGDFYTEPGQTDTITVTVYNHSDNPENFNVYSYTEEWSVWPPSRSLYIYGHESGNVDFYFQAGAERQDDSNWFAFKAEYDSHPNYWDTDTTYVYLAGVEPPQNVMIGIVDDIVTISWDEVPGCTYNVYSSSDPYEPFESWFNEISGIPETFWCELVSEKKFFYITAASD